MRLAGLVICVNLYRVKLLQKLLLKLVQVKQITSQYYSDKNSCFQLNCTGPSKFTNSIHASYPSATNEYEDKDDFPEHALNSCACTAWLSANCVAGLS